MPGKHQRRPLTKRDLRESGRWSSQRWRSLSKTHPLQNDSLPRAHKACWCRNVSNTLHSNSSWQNSNKIQIDIEVSIQNQIGRKACVHSSLNEQQRPWASLAKTYFSAKILYYIYIYTYTLYIHIYLFIYIKPIHTQHIFLII